MGSPFNKDSARKKPAAAIAALPAGPLRTKADAEWEWKCRKFAQGVRANAGVLWRGSKYGAIPRACLKVPEAHSTNQQTVYLMLQAIGRGEYNRDATNRAAPITGKVLGEYDYLVTVSKAALAFLCGLRVSTVCDALKQLAAKHSIAPTLERVRGEKESNRDATTYRVPDFNAVLAARRADPAIASTHGALDPKSSLQWHNNRANSRRLLTPEQAKEWGLYMAPGRPKAPPAEKPAELATPAAVAEVAAMPAAPISTHAALVSRPTKKKIVAPKDVQAGLDDLNYGEPFDAAAQLIGALEAVANKHGKTWPVSRTVTWARAFLEKKGRQHVADGWKWKVDNVVGYLLRCAENELAPEAENLKALQLIDAHERRQAKDREATIGRMQSCLAQLRERPGDDRLREWRADLERENAELFYQVAMDDDLAHGGDGLMSSWNNVYAAGGDSS